MTKTIAVLGGTGLLGWPVALRLNEDGFQVRIMTRDRQKAEKMFDGSFEIAAGDPANFRSLEEALKGCQGVHISLPSEVERTAAKLAAKAAAKNGLERISYISGRTVAEENRWFPMINRKFQAEQAIRESGVPYTIFCPTMFMELLPMFVVKGRASVMGKQPHPFHWVAAEDFARMVSAAFKLEEAASQRQFVLGPEAIPMREALSRYCAAFHPEIKKVATMPFWLVKLVAAVTGDQGLKGAGELMSYFEKVGEQSSNPATADGLLGTPATTLDIWLQKQKGEER